MFILLFPIGIRMKHKLFKELVESIKEGGRILKDIKYIGILHCENGFATSDKIYWYQCNNKSVKVGDYVVVDSLIKHGGELFLSLGWVKIVSNSDIGLPIKPKNTILSVIKNNGKYSRPLTEQDFMEELDGQRIF